MRKIKFNEEKAKDLFKKFKKDPILGSLSFSELLNLLEISHMVQFDMNEFIVKQGERDTLVFILISGTIEIIHNGNIIKTLDTLGEIIGEMSLITKDVRSASVRAANKVECLSIDSTFFTESKTEHKNIIYYIFSQVLANRLNAAIEELSELKKENEILWKGGNP